MTDAFSIANQSPILEIIIKQDGKQRCLKLSGDWNLRNLTRLPKLRQEIERYAGDKTVLWDMDSIKVLDNAAALIIWLAWGKQIPPSLRIKREHLRLLERWHSQQIPESEPRTAAFYILIIEKLNRLLIDFWFQLIALVMMLGQLVLDVIYLTLHPKEIPWSEISTTIYESGVRALGITALVGFLIGIVLSYLSALQLKMFGAQIYIINILSLSIIRELGPLLAAILVAGRSGSAMTAQIGIMRVTEELDALSTMGISHSMRLVLPNVAALTLVLPLLSIWTSAAALLGGMFSAENTLDIGYRQFFDKIPDTVPFVNVFICLGKSAVFGLMIALIACHFGFRIKPNTESLGEETTNSVVAAITIVIMIDSCFAILFRNVGMP